ncbi:rhomboid family intramembrane serine protease [Pontibacter sp. JH31]|uniref:Rhomboid family intramembrane serine protease n=1 Tax=Pontibacter aquaedesilientis TaxID=2766980 RepID=A0ABR7XB95_9BACT|nr:rhomboid family intramembrane serine protease [Pontibacter aquaedesilientis]MBD1395588.1 rhomboid family intramembrane serine protease [Pontibacter aquaedesilientis]
MASSSSEIALTDLQAENERFAYSFLPGTLFIALIWLIALLVYLTGVELSWLGIRPREFFGLIGVVAGPLIHSGLNHLLSNSFPLVLLSGFILFLHRPVALRVVVLVYVLSGLFTWFIGRDAYHVGASGVVYGLAGFLLFNGIMRRDRAGLAVSLAVLFLYGGLFYGLFPSEERISWEGHLGGLIAGLVAAVVYGEHVESKKEALLPEQTPDAQHAISLQQRHQSSTLAQGPYTWRYTIATGQPEAKHEFACRVNPRTGMAEALTHPTKYSSTSK